jgi:hypothetical protein
MDFIAPRILKEDIETIWKMQVFEIEKEFLRFKAYFYFSMVVL